MLNAIAFAVVAAQGQAIEIDAKFMAHATYHAGSAIKDPTAPGGFGPSDNLPVPIANAELLSPYARARLSIKDGVATLTLTNGSKEVVWLNAADSNLLGFMEAKDAKGAWKPIEYHWRYTCGNSFHRVALPPAHGLIFETPLPTGPLKTKVRWRIASGQTTITSNETVASIPNERFQLSPEDRLMHELRTTGEYPVLWGVGR